jgi:hypothetical protein
VSAQNSDNFKRPSLQRVSAQNRSELWIKVILTKIKPIFNHRPKTKQNKKIFLTRPYPNL